MRHVFVCPMDDDIVISGFELYSEQRIYGGLTFETFVPQEGPLYPFVPAYFQPYNQQRGPLREFLREHYHGLKPHSYLLALHDDATDLEAHALSELLIACGAKETLMEYRAFLLSSEMRYIAVTGSKRAVTVTMVQNDQDETERIFVPISEANFDSVMDAVHELDPDGSLPVYRFGVSQDLQMVGEAVNSAEIVRNFVKML
jgi:hypothetical protein